MTLYHFNSLDEMEQIEAIWDHRVKIGERQDKVYKYNLYQIDSFYLEEQIHLEWDIRRGCKTFSTTDLLVPYVKNIKIDNL